MTIRHKLVQIRTQFPLLLEGCLLTILSLFFFYMPSEPGLISNLVAWLESDGRYYGQSAAIVLLLWGLALIFLFFGRCCNRYAIFSKGKLLLSIEQGLFDKAVKAMWAEFFHNKELSVRTRFQRSRLEIVGEAPEGWHALDTLMESIVQQLASQTGYMGPIHITITHKREIPEMLLNRKES